MFRLKIIPDSNKVDLIAEANIYHKIWKQYKKQILEAFYQTTGLEFQQKQITARVTNKERSFAGDGIQAMQLASQWTGNEKQRYCSLLHELGHRLLSGNGLGSWALGYDDPQDLESENEVDHRILFLFLEDTAKLCFPANISVQIHQNDKYANGDSYYKAYTWVKRLTKKQRTSVLTAITAKKVEREQWSAKSWTDETWLNRRKEVAAKEYLKYLDSLVS